MDALSLIAVIAGALLVPMLALHVWYAIGLSRVFAARGAEPWRAWVPLVNEAEIFRLGRLDPVRAVLLVVPLVNVYGLVLKATAAHRLGSSAGRGAGATALALIFPPAWATLLATKPRTDAAPAGSGSGVAVAEQPLVRAETGSGPIATVPGTNAAQLATAGRRRSTAVAVEPVAVPVLPGPVDIDEVAFEQTSIHPSRRRGAAAVEEQNAEAAAPHEAAVAAASDKPGEGLAPVAASAGAPAGEAVSRASASGALREAGENATATTAAPAGAFRAQTSATPSSAPVPVSASDPAAEGASVAAASMSAPAPAASPSLPAPAPAAPESEDGVLDRVAETTDSTAAPAHDRVPATAVPLEEHTQTVRQRSRRRGEWSLTLPDGQTVALTQRTIVLGRKPGDDDESVQSIAVADETRTMSKKHARLEWTVTGWTITDLDSTNGVTLVHDDGRTERVTPGGTAVAPARFRLGDASVELKPASSA